MNRKLLIIPSVAVALGLGSIAYASIPAPNGTIDGCYSNSTHPHQLFIRDSTASCPSGDTSLTWSQTGPAGPAGPAGPLYVTTGTLGHSGPISPGSSVSLGATCPSGSVLVSMETYVAGTDSSGDKNGDNLAGYVLISGGISGTSTVQVSVSSSAPSDVEATILPQCLSS